MIPLVLSRCTDQCPYDSVMKRKEKEDQHMAISRKHLFRSATKDAVLLSFH